MAGSKLTSKASKAGNNADLNKDYHVYPLALRTETLAVRDARLAGGFETVAGWIKKDRLEEFWKEYNTKIGSEDLKKFEANWDLSEKNSEEYLELITNLGAICDQQGIGELLYPAVVVSAMEDAEYVAVRLWTCRKALFEHTLLGSFFATEEEVKQTVDSVWTIPREADKDKSSPELNIIGDDQEDIDRQKEIQRENLDSIRPLWDTVKRCTSIMIETTEKLTAITTQGNQNESTVRKELNKIHSHVLEILNEFSDYGIETKKIEEEIKIIVDITKSIRSSYPKMDGDKLKLLFDTISNLPSGEIERLATTVYKRAEKWSESIPKKAPELFKDRAASENLPDFLRRVYGGADLLDGKLTTAHFDIIDMPLSGAIRNWIKHHGALPDDINLPNKVQRERGTPRKVSRQQHRKRVLEK